MWIAKGRSQSSLEKCFVCPFYVHPRHCVEFGRTENSSIRAVCIHVCRSSDCSSVSGMDPKLLRDTH